MIAAIVLALAAANADVITVDEGCRLVRKAPVAVVKRKAARKPAPAASAASAPASAPPLFKPRPKRRSMLGIYPVPADYDLLCDEDQHAPAAPIYYTPIPEVPYALAEPVEPQALPPAVPPLDLYVVPMTFEEGADLPPVTLYVPPGAIGGPCCYVGSPGQIPAAPEAQTWALMLAGIGAIAFISWRRKWIEPMPVAVLVVSTPSMSICAIESA